MGLYHAGALAAGLWSTQLEERYLEGWVWSTVWVVSGVSVLMEEHLLS